MVFKFVMPVWIVVKSVFNAARSLPTLRQLGVDVSHMAFDLLYVSFQLEETFHKCKVHGFAAL